ncbi:hypothetical protein HD806DRAFT_225690 [Xylariaceae sp. AK1471]|nr:hypothetical protein HD806DRAFT_225690 [Xylariaceae sp. AK1471]
MREIPTFKVIWGTPRVASWNVEAPMAWYSDAHAFFMWQSIYTLSSTSFKDSFLAQAADHRCVHSLAPLARTSRSSLTQTRKDRTSLISQATQGRTAKRLQQLTKRATCLVVVLPDTRTVHGHKQ